MRRIGGAAAGAAADNQFGAFGDIRHRKRSASKALHGPRTLEVILVD
jgi:hypothetical protein